MLPRGAGSTTSVSRFFRCSSRLSAAAGESIDLQHDQPDPDRHEERQSQHGAQPQPAGAVGQLRRLGRNRRLGRPARRPRPGAGPAPLGRRGPGVKTALFVPRPPAAFRSVRPAAEPFSVRPAANRPSPRPAAERLSRPAVERPSPRPAVERPSVRPAVRRGLASAPPAPGTGGRARRSPPDRPRSVVGRPRSPVELGFLVVELPGLPPSPGHPCPAGRSPGLGHPRRGLSPASGTRAIPVTVVCVARPGHGRPCCGDPAAVVRVARPARGLVAARSPPRARRRGDLRPGTRRCGLGARGTVVLVVRRRSGRAGRRRGPAAPGGTGRCCGRPAATGCAGHPRARSGRAACRPARRRCRRSPGPARRRERAPSAAGPEKKRRAGARSPGAASRWRAASPATARRRAGSPDRARSVPARPVRHRGSGARRHVAVVASCVDAPVPVPAAPGRCWPVAPAGCWPRGGACLLLAGRSRRLLARRRRLPAAGRSCTGPARRRSRRCWPVVAAAGPARSRPPGRCPASARRTPCRRASGCTPACRP